MASVSAPYVVQWILAYLLVAVAIVIGVLLGLVIFEACIGVAYRRHRRRRVASDVDQEKEAAALTWNAMRERGASSEGEGALLAMMVAKVNSLETRVSSLKTNYDAQEDINVSTARTHSLLASMASFGFITETMAYVFSSLFSMVMYCARTATSHPYLLGSALVIYGTTQAFLLFQSDAFALVDDLESCDIRPFTVETIVPAVEILSMAYQVAYGGIYLNSFVLQTVIRSTANTGITCAAPAIVPMVYNATDVAADVFTATLDWLELPDPYAPKSTINVTDVWDDVCGVAESAYAPIECFCKAASFVIEPIVSQLPKLGPAFQAAVDAALEIGLKIEVRLGRLIVADISADLEADGYGKRWAREAAGKWLYRSSRTTSGGQDSDDSSEDIGATSNFNDTTVGRPDFYQFCNRTGDAVVYATEWVDDVMQAFVAEASDGVVDDFPPVAEIAGRVVASALNIVGSGSASLIRIDKLISDPVDYADSYVFNEHIWYNLYVAFDRIETMLDFFLYGLPSLGAIVKDAGHAAVDIVRSILFGLMELIVSLVAMSNGQLTALQVSQRLDARVNADLTFSDLYQVCADLGDLVANLTDNFSYFANLSCAVNFAARSAVSLILAAYTFVRILVLSWIVGALPVGGLGGAFATGWANGAYGAFGQDFLSFGECMGNFFDLLPQLQWLSDLTYAVFLVTYASLTALTILGFDGACVSAQQDLQEAYPDGPTQPFPLCSGSTNFGVQLAYSWDQGYYDVWYAAFESLFEAVGDLLSLTTLAGVGCMASAVGDCLAGLLMDVSEVFVGVIECASLGENTSDCFYSRAKAGNMNNFTNALYELGDCLQLLGDALTGGDPIGFGDLLMFATRVLSDVVASLFSIVVAAVGTSIDDPTSSEAETDEQAGSSYGIFAVEFYAAWESGPFFALESDLIELGAAVGQILGQISPLFDCLISEGVEFAVYLVWGAIDVAVRFSQPDTAYFGQLFFDEWYSGDPASPYALAGAQFSETVGCVGQFLDQTVWAGAFGGPGASGGMQCFFYGLGQVIRATAGFVAEILVIAAHAAYDPQYQSSAGFKTLLQEGWSSGALGGISAALSQTAQCGVDLSAEITTSFSCAISNAVSAVADVLLALGTFVAIFFDSENTASLQAVCQAIYSQLFATQLGFQWIQDIASALACLISFLLGESEMGTLAGDVIYSALMIARYTLDAVFTFVLQIVIQGTAASFTRYLWNQFAPQLSFVGYSYGEFQSEDVFGSSESPSDGGYNGGDAMPISLWYILGNPSAIAESHLCDTAPGSGTLLKNPLFGMCLAASSMGSLVNYVTALVPACVVTTAIQTVAGALSDALTTLVAFAYSVTPAATEYSAEFDAGGRPGLGELATMMRAVEVGVDFYYYGYSELSPCLGQFGGSFFVTPPDFNSTLFASRSFSSSSTFERFRSTRAAGAKGESTRTDDGFDVDALAEALSQLLTDILGFAFILVYTVPQLFIDITLPYGSDSAGIAAYSPSVPATYSLGALADSFLAGRYNGPINQFIMIMNDLQPIGSATNIPGFGSLCGSIGWIGISAALLLEDLGDLIAWIITVSSVESWSIGTKLVAISAALGSSSNLRNDVTYGNAPTLREWFAPFQSFADALGQTYVEVSGDFGLSGISCMLSNVPLILPAEYDFLLNLAGSLLQGIGNAVLLADQSDVSADQTVSQLFGSFYESWNAQAFQGIVTTLVAIGGCVASFADAWYPGLGTLVEQLVTAAVDLIQAVVDLAFRIINAIVSEQSVGKALHQWWYSSSYVAQATTSLQAAESAAGEVADAINPLFGCLVDNGAEFFRALLASVIQFAVMLGDTTWRSYGGQNSEGNSESESEEPSFAQILSDEWTQSVYQRPFDVLDDLSSCVGDLGDLVSDQVGTFLQYLLRALTSLLNWIFGASVGIISALAAGTDQALIAWTTAQIDIALGVGDGTLASLTFSNLTTAFQSLAAAISFGEEYLEALLSAALVLALVEIPRMVVKIFFVLLQGLVGSTVYAGGVFGLLYSDYASTTSAGNDGGVECGQFFDAVSNFALALGAIVQAATTLAPLGDVVQDLVLAASCAVQFALRTILSLTGGLAMGVASNPLTMLQLLYSTSDPYGFQNHVVTPLIAIANDLGDFLSLIDPSIGCAFASLSQLVIQVANYELAFVLYLYDMIVDGEVSVQNAQYYVLQSAISSVGDCIQDFLGRFTSEGTCSSGEVQFFCCFAQLVQVVFDILNTTLEKVLVYALGAVFAGGSFLQVLDLSEIIQEIQDFMGAIACIPASLIFSPGGSCNDDGWRSAMQLAISSILDIVVVPFQVLQSFIAPALPTSGSEEGGSAEEQATNYAAGLIQGIISAVISVPVNILNAAGAVFNCLASGAGDFFTTIASLIQDIASIFTGFFITIIEDIITLLVDLFTNPSEFVADLSALFMAIFNEVDSSFQELGTELIKILGLGALCRDIISAVNDILTFLNEVAAAFACLQPGCLECANYAACASCPSSAACLPSNECIPTTQYQTSSVWCTDVSYDDCQSSYSATYDTLHVETTSNSYCYSSSLGDNSAGQSACSGAYSNGGCTGNDAACVGCIQDTSGECYKPTGTCTCSTSSSCAGSAPSISPVNEGVCPSSSSESRKRSLTDGTGKKSPSMWDVRSFVDSSSEAYSEEFGSANATEIIIKSVLATSIYALAMESDGSVNLFANATGAVDALLGFGINPSFFVNDTSLQQLLTKLMQEGEANATNYMSLILGGLFSWNGTTVCDALISQNFAQLSAWGQSDAMPLPLVDDVLASQIRECVSKRLFTISIGKALGWNKIPQDMLYNWATPILTFKDAFLGLSTYMQCFINNHTCDSNMTSLVQAMTAAGVSQPSTPVFFIKLLRAILAKAMGGSIFSVLGGLAGQSTVAALVTDLYLLTTKVTNSTTSMLSASNTSVTAQAAAAYAGISSLYTYMTTPPLVNSTNNSSDDSSGGSVDDSVEENGGGSESNSSSGSSPPSSSEAAGSESSTGDAGNRRRSEPQRIRSARSANSSSNNNKLHWTTPMSVVLRHQISSGIFAFSNHAETSPAHSRLVAKGPRAIAYEMMDFTIQSKTSLLNYVRSHAHSVSRAVESLSSITPDGRAARFQDADSGGDREAGFSKKDGDPLRASDTTKDHTSLATARAFEWISKIQGRSAPRQSKAEKWRSEFGVAFDIREPKSAILREWLHLRTNPMTATSINASNVDFIFAEALGVKGAPGQSRPNATATTAASDGFRHLAPARKISSRRAGSLSAKQHFETTSAERAETYMNRVSDAAKSRAQQGAAHAKGFGRAVRFYPVLQASTVDEYVDCAALAGGVAGVTNVISETFFYYAELLPLQMESFAAKVADPHSIYDSVYVAPQVPSWNASFGVLLPLADAVLDTDLTQDYVAQSSDSDSGNNVPFIQGLERVSIGTVRSAATYFNPTNVANAVKKLIDEAKAIPSPGAAIEAGEAALVPRVESIYNALYGLWTCDRTALLDGSAARMTALQGLGMTVITLVAMSFVGYAIVKLVLVVVTGPLAALTLVGAALMTSGSFSSEPSGQSSSTSSLLMSAAPIYLFWTYGSVPSCGLAGAPPRVFEDAIDSLMQSILAPQLPFGQLKMTQSWPPPTPEDPLPPSWAALSPEQCAARTYQASPLFGIFGGTTTRQGVDPSEFLTCRQLGMDGNIAASLFYLRANYPYAFQWLGESQWSPFFCWLSPLSWYPTSSYFLPYFDWLALDRSNPVFPPGAPASVQAYMTSIVQAMPYPSPTFPTNSTRLDLQGIGGPLVLQPVEPPQAYHTCFDILGGSTMALALPATFAVVIVGMFALLVVIFVVGTILSAMSLVPFYMSTRSYLGIINSRYSAIIEERIADKRSRRQPISRTGRPYSARSYR